MPTRTPTIDPTATRSATVLSVVSSSVFPAACSREYLCGFPVKTRSLLHTAQDTRKTSSLGSSVRWGTYETSPSSSR